MARFAPKTISVNSAAGPLLPRQRLITPGLPTSIQKASSSATDLPSGGMLGPYSTMGMDPETSPPGKGIRKQHLGTVVGKRGAGLSQLGGGDQGAHSMNHYGKKGLPGLTGGDLT